MNNDSMLSSLKFPQKLWHIINQCQTGAISWNLSGHTILLNYKKFQEEYLTKEDKIFKTNNITSFIRQLNMYGFRKVASHKSEVWNINNQNVHEFVHENFKCGRIDLLEKVSRKTGTRGNKAEHINEEITENLLTEDPCKKNEDLPMTQLQTYKLLLQKALQEAIIRYKAYQTRETLEEVKNFQYEEFKFYYVHDPNRLAEKLESVTLYVPKITKHNHRDWYSEALISIMDDQNIYC